MYKRDIYLDIDDELNNYIKSVELDSDSRVWHFHLTVDYEPLDLTGKSVQFRAEKPDKTNVLNDCKIVDAEKGVVEVKLTRQVNAIPGHVKCLLKIIGDEGFVLKTKTFVVDVSKTLSDDAVVSSDEFGALDAALGKVQDIDNRFAQTNAQLSHAVLNPKIFGAKGDGLTDDLQSFNDMVAYGKANRIKHIKVYPGDYKLSDTFYLPSGWTLEGNGRVVIRQESQDAPVVATEEWKTGDRPYGETKVLGINIRGGSGLNNHGLLIYDYYSTVDRVYVNDVGGRGIFFTSINSNGTAPAGSLVENTITNCHVRRTGDICYYLGENNNNRLTDGIVQNCMGSSPSGVDNVLYIGSSAGWFVDNIHTYGKPNVAISLRNSFYTTVNNIYIEDFLTHAMALHIQNTLSVNNVSVRLNSDIANDVNVILIGKSSVEVGEANCTINNLNMVTCSISSDVNVNGVNISTSKTRCSISNYNVVGETPSKVTKIAGTKTNLNYLDSFMVEKPIAESRYNLLYDDKKLKYCDSAKFSGSTPVSLTFRLQDLANYGKIMCDVAICGCAYDNGTLLTSYTSKLMISAKDNNQNEWRTYAISESAKTGFATEPAFSVNKLTGELTVTFTPSDNRNTGVVAIDFVSIS